MKTRTIVSVLALFGLVLMMANSVGAAPLGGSVNYWSVKTQNISQSSWAWYNGSDYIIKSGSNTEVRMKICATGAPIVAFNITLPATMVYLGTTNYTNFTAQTDFSNTSSFLSWNYTGANDAAALIPAGGCNLFGWNATVTGATTAVMRMNLTVRNDTQAVTVAFNKTFYIDSGAAPTISITSPTEDATIADTSINFVYTVTDTLQDNITCVIDSDPDSMNSTATNSVSKTQEFTATSYEGRRCYTITCYDVDGYSVVSPQYCFNQPARDVNASTVIVYPGAGMQAGPTPTPSQSLIGGVIEAAENVIGSNEEPTIGEPSTPTGNNNVLIGAVLLIVAVAGYWYIENKN